MQPTYLSFPAKELLDEFGAGRAVPGAGSASALSGLLAAQLVLTVCKLTLKKDTHEAHHKDLRTISKRIEAELIPTLEVLLQRDAGAFALVHEQRVARDATLDPIKRQRHINAEHRHMKAAVAIPLEIAAVCMEVADYAARVFKDGLQHVRGDSGVALSTAVSSVLSCVFVVNLNLKDFEQSHWSNQRRAECDQLLREVTAKHQAALGSLRDLRLEAIAASQPEEGSEPIVSFGARAKQRYTDDDIEERARRLGNQMWLRRAQIWSGEAEPSDPSKVLDPERALGLLGYSYELVDTLGTIKHGSTSYEVAGILEAQPGHVRVSGQMASEIRLFTAAHELGHVVLHPHLKEAHRDRPLDGSVPAREQVEREADRFAAAFLMPAKLVRAKFAAIFGASPFQINDETVYALGLDPRVAREKYKDQRELSMLLARTVRFNRKSFNSLATQFGVSVTTMAIRLEELKLVE